MVISYSLWGFAVFLKVPSITIIRVGENNVLVTIYIDRYLFGGGRYMVHLAFLGLLFIKTEKLQEHGLY